jgi:hypothetical protein
MHVPILQLQWDKHEVTCSLGYAKVARTHPSYIMPTTYIFHHTQRKTALAGRPACPATNSRRYGMARRAGHPATNSTGGCRAQRPRRRRQAPGVHSTKKNPNGERHARIYDE